MNIFAEDRRRKNIRRWGGVILLLILIGICLLSFVLTYRPVSASEMLAVSFQSNRIADYSADPISALLPPVKPAIIEDVIKDKEPTNVPERLETVQVILKTPVPTVTPVPTSTPTPVGGVTPGLTLTPATNTPIPTATSKTPTNTIVSLPNPSTATSTATRTLVTPVPSGTSVESPTPTLISTKAPPTHQPTKNPTSTPKKTPTPTEPFPVVTPTYTPTSTKIPTRTPTLIPTRTSTPIPTKTPTVSVCSPPDRVMGFVASTDPEHKAVNVPLYINVVIQFNQPMKEADLFRNIRISGTRVPSEMSYDSKTFTLEIDFLRLLERDTKVKITIKRNIKNICDQRQVRDVKFEFETMK